MCKAWVVLHILINQNKKDDQVGNLDGNVNYTVPCRQMHIGPCKHSIKWSPQRSMVKKKNTHTHKVETMEREQFPTINEGQQQTQDQE